MAEIRRPLIVDAGRRRRLATTEVLPGASIDQIAGLAPTLDLDFERQVYRHYSPSTGLRSKPLSDIVTFTRASSATYFDATGVMRTAASDEPRIDFDPVTGLCRGLLIEEARTNLWINDNDPATSFTAKIGVSFTTGVADPFGGTAAFTITATASSAVAGKAVAGTASVPYTGSVWIRRRTGTGIIGIILGDNIGDFSLSSSITGEWKCIQLTKTPTTTVVRLYLQITNAGDEVDVAFFQLEQGSFATSYIPTTNAAATRAADVAVISGTAFSDFYRQSLGSIFADYRLGKKLAGMRVFSLVLDGSSFLEVIAGAGTPPSVMSGGYLYGAVSGVTWSTSSAESTPTNTADTRRKFAGAFAPGDAAHTNNGISSMGTASPSSIPEFAAARLGNNISQSSQMICGHIARLAYWPQRLPNATLQQLTAG